MAETEEQASSSEDDPTTIGPMFAAMGALFAMFVGVAVYFKMKRRRSAAGAGQRRDDRGLSADDSRAGSAFSIGSAGSAASVGSMQSVASVAYDASTQSVMVGSHHSRY